jgi:hypothetical protein
MHLWRRVFYRAQVLTETWVHQNAFVLGVLFGGGLTLLVLFAH